MLHQLNSMKGMMLISFQKTTGAYLDVEYPKGLTKQLGFTPADVNVPYSINRMNNMKPMFNYIKVNNVMVASFYSGFDFNDYIGHPDKCLYLILDNENPNKFEGILIRLATDILPKFKEIDPICTLLDRKSEEYKIKFKEFEAFFEEKYHDIEQNRVIPMNIEDAEIIVGKGSSIKTIGGEHTGKAKEVEKQEVDIQKFLEDMKKKTEITQAAKKMEEMEKDQLRDEIKKYEIIIKDKDERIRNLELQIQNTASLTSQLGVTQQVMQKIEELAQMLGEKDQELNKWKEKATEMNEKLFVHQDTIAKMTEMSMLQSEEMQVLNRKNKSMADEIKTLKHDNETLKQEISILNQQIESIKNLLQEKDTLISELSHAQKMQKYADVDKTINPVPQNIILQNTTDGASKAIEELQRQLEGEREEKKQLQQQLGEYKSVTIELKKDIKIARREIESLKEKLNQSTII